MERDVFIYGAQYYRAPNPPRGERRRDIEQMARLGFNVVKLQAHWNWINYGPGAFDFDEIEEMMDYAAQNGLGVILMSNLENAPWWLVQQHPEARYRTADGGFWTSRPWEAPLPGAGRGCASTTSLCAGRPRSSLLSLWGGSRTIQPSPTGMYGRSPTWSPHPTWERRGTYATTSSAVAMRA